MKRVLKRATLQKLKARENDSPPKVGIEGLDSSYDNSILLVHDPAFFFAELEARNVDYATNPVLTPELPEDYEPVQPFTN